MPSFGLRTGAGAFDSLVQSFDRSKRIVPDSPPELSRYPGAMVEFQWLSRLLCKDVRLWSQGAPESPERRNPSDLQKG